MAFVVHLDTHVVVWLAQGLSSKLSPQAKRLIENEELQICPFVSLELTFLYEIGRLKGSPDGYLPDLMARLGIRFCGSDTEDLVRQAAVLSWARDPFDRMIVGAAAMHDARFLTKDELIKVNYAKTVW
jgi:PIN domain nuclease of toxin-antitoxin system